MFAFIGFITLLLLGFFVGRYLESQHFSSIAQREAELVVLPNTSSRYLLIPMQQIERSELVTGSVVISIDYFKRIVAGLRSLVGGPVQSYETLLDRARREAMLRMKESCPGASQIINIRIETSSIYNAAGNGIGSVELLAYGTAIYGQVAVNSR
ncbi:YbjQ family protein [Arsukibacterium sp.]|uniref:YbjQ family protein n=1 Tax=Arsukibacterium sp. TaxID=1977258 RepID=UPI002FDAFC9F